VPQTLDEAVAAIVKADASIENALAARNDEATHARLHEICGVAGETDN